MFSHDGAMPERTLSHILGTERRGRRAGFQDLLADARVTGSDPGCLRREPRALWPPVDRAACRDKSKWRYGAHTMVRAGTLRVASRPTRSVQSAAGIAGEGGPSRLWRA